MNRKYYYTLREKILVTEHAIKRFQERQRDELTREEIINKIINQVRESKLIGINNKEEHRTHKGYVYVCKRERDYSGEKLIVVTLKLSGVRKREKYNRFCELEKAS